MSKEAMKLALEALNAATRYGAGGFEDAKDALRAALAKPDFWEGYVPEPVKPAPSECQTEAEKTAYAFGWWKALESQRALDKKAANAKELGLDYEPVCNKDPQGCWNVRCQLGKKCKNTSAQQEPVATDWERIARVQDAKLRAMCNESGGFEKLCEVMDRYEHTSPQPAQQEPVAWMTKTGSVWKTKADETDTPLYTFPPAQRTWVGLTDEERKLVRNSVGYNQFVTAGEYAEHVQKATEFKLLEKNT